MTIVFEGFEFDPQSGDLWDTNGDLTRLRPKAAAVLAVLVAKPREVVTREEIASEVWAGTLIEYDLGVNACIKELRAALKDDAKNPTYIETLPRRGYRFAAETNVPKQARTATRNVNVGSLVLGSLAAVAVLIGAFGVWRVAGPDPRISMAVLPFETLESDSQSVYLAAALTADVISDLARADWERLGVTAKTSTNLYRGASKPIAEIGRELGVEYVLEGTLRHHDGGFRIALRLIRAPDQSQVWAREYHRPMSEVLHQLPAEVATGVLQGLAVEWSPPDRERGAVPSSLPSDSAFRDRYLRARYLLSNQTVRATRLADSLLTQALENERGYAPAWDALAETRIRLGNVDGARTAVDRAIELSPANAEALTRRGFIRLMINLDRTGARQDFIRAAEIAPGLATVHHGLALLHVVEGDYRAALREGEYALRLDPVSPLVQADIGWFFVYARQPSDGERHCTRAAELAPAELAHRKCMLAALILQNRIDDAQSVAADILSLKKFPDSIVTDIRGAAGERGLAMYWQAIAMDARLAGESGLVENAVANAQLGNLEESLDAIEAALSVMSLLDLVFLFDHPLLDPVRSSNRFRMIQATSGVPHREERP